MIKVCNPYHARNGRPLLLFLLPNAVHILIVQSFAKGSDEIYIAGGDGIYSFKKEKFQREKISDTENLREVNCIESRDGVLWALSEKKLLRFGMGNEWEVFEHPNNIK